MSCFGVVVVSSLLWSGPRRNTVERSVFCPMTDVRLSAAAPPWAGDQQPWCSGAITGEPCWPECESACDGPSWAR